MKENKLLCGYADMDITPERPVWLDGFAARSKPSDGVRDPLYLKVLSLKDSCGTECLILVFDILGFDKYLSEKVRNVALSASALPDENVMIVATHTHSGLASGGLYALPKDEEHWNYVISEIPNVIDRARAACVEVAPTLDETEIKIGMNRRCIVDGKVVIGANPDKMRDDCLRVLRFVSDEKTIGALLNTSCHPVNLSASSMRVSADYPSVLHAYAKEKDNFFALFTNSACGNINPLRPHGDDSEANLTACGGELVKALEKVMKNQVPESTDKVKLSCSSKDILLPLQINFSKAELEDKYGYWIKQMNTSTDPNVVYRARVYSNWYKIQLDAMDNADGNFVKARVRLLDMGPFALITLPFETFVETRASLCRAYEALTGKKLIVCGCADRVFAYLPDPVSLAEGGYETEGACAWYAVPGNYTLLSEPTLVSECEKLFSER